MYKISQQYCELPLHLAAEPGVKPRAAFELWCCYLLFLDTAVPNWNNKQKKAMHAHTQPSWHKKAAAQAAGGTNTSSARNLSWAQTHPTARVLGSEQAARHGTAWRFAAPARTFPKPSLDHVQLRSLLLPFSLHSCGISKSATRLPPALLLAEGEGGIRRQAAEPPAKSREGTRKVQNLLPRPQLMLAVSGVSTP